MKMGIFLDTGFFLGLCHPADEYHKESVSLLRVMSSGKYGLIYTSPFIIAETATLILVRTRNNQKIIEAFFDLLYGSQSFIRILPWSGRLETKTCELFKKVNKQAQLKKDYMSYVDISNISYCKENQIDNLASFDSHFDSFITRIS